MSRWLELNIYIGETDQWKHQSLYLALIEMARDYGLAGATVTRGIAGFGEKARIRTTRILALSVDLPLVVTIVDQAAMINEFIPVVREMVQSGLITVQPITVIESVQAKSRRSGQFLRTIRASRNKQLSN